VANTLSLSRVSGTRAQGAQHRTLQAKLVVRAGKPVEWRLHQRQREHRRHHEERLAVEPIRIRCCTGVTGYSRFSTGCGLWGLRKSLTQILHVRATYLWHSGADARTIGVLRNGSVKNTHNFGRFFRADRVYYKTGLGSGVKLIPQNTYVAELTWWANATPDAYDIAGLRNVSYFKSLVRLLGKEGTGRGTLSRPDLR
jgi:hypothetical protein